MVDQEARRGILIAGGGFAGSYVARLAAPRQTSRQKPRRERQALPLPVTGRGGDARTLQRDRFGLRRPDQRLPRLADHKDVSPLQLPLLSRKLRVVTNWTVALFFRRDIVELSVLEQPRRLGDD
jgi:hypothetical protein